jgi:hypothetical protein
MHTQAFFVKLDSDIYFRSGSREIVVAYKVWEVQFDSCHEMIAST